MLINEIKQKLEDLGIRPTKIRGQNFLVDEYVLRAILEASEISKDDTILEIGPGLGVLTSELLKSAHCVIAVELDQTLVKSLESLIALGLNLRFGDVRQMSNTDLVNICGAKDYKLVANIPYNITSDILEKFLIEEPAPKIIVLLVQHEVAKRIISEPPDVSRLGVFVNYFGSPEVVKFVSKESFWPKPKVDSAILKIRRYPIEVFKKREAKFSREDFFRLVKFGFSAPRRKLISNLSGGLNLSKASLEGIFKKLKISADSRAEILGIRQWLDLAETVFRKN